MREERKEKASYLKEAFLRSCRGRKSQSFSLLDLEKFSLPQLEEAGVAEAELDLRLLIQEAFSLDTKDYLLRKREAVSSFCPSEALNSELSRFFSFLEQRLQRIPLSQILGRQEFFGLSFLVNENVLSPRQDTECIVERILLEEEKISEKQLSVLDLCTGSGCIGLTLAKHLPCPKLLLLDKSREALEVAKENYRRLFPDKAGEALPSEQQRVYFLESDLFAALPSLMEEKDISGFDILVSNPPYIRRDVLSTLDDEVALHEPRIALDGGVDGLDFYRRIAKEGKRFLLPGGRIYLEIGYDQGESVKNIFQKEGFTNVEVFQDYEGRDRGVRGTFPP
nr:peptide chain release factor N(5)-glutamine methyltransferase [uncultured Oribacterium sp.]